MKTYKNKESGLNVITGTIKSISDDRLCMTVTTQEWDTKAKENKPLEINVTTPIAFEDKYKAGYAVTVAGYQQGKNVISANAVLIGNDYFDGQDLAVLSGIVRDVRLNTEKNEDGTPKMKMDGVTPRKPHFDISISVKEGDKYVNHVIKVYDFAATDGKKSNMEKAQAIFKNFDREKLYIVC